MSEINDLRDNAEECLSKAYSRKNIARAGKSLGYKYKRDDFVSESRNVRENKSALSQLEISIKKMQNQAKNGFRNLTPIKQRELVFDKKREIRNILGIGSFHFDEMSEIFDEYCLKVEEIYEPYLKN